MFNQKLIEKIPRIKGGRNARIDYRHIIGSLIKKPGAFQNYKYREELFPSLQFRMAYDQLHIHGKSGVKDYLRILQLAAINGEEQVQKALMLSAIEKEITLENVKENIEIADTFDLTGMTESGEADLGVYDSLITPGES